MCGFVDPQVSHTFLLCLIDFNTLGETLRLDSLVRGLYIKDVSAYSMPNNQHQSANSTHLKELTARGKAEVGGATLDLIIRRRVRQEKQHPAPS